MNYVLHFCILSDDKKQIWAFGGGHRSCIGKALMKMMLLVRIGIKSCLFVKNLEC